jgi:hypothetical protein
MVLGSVGAAQTLSMLKVEAKDGGHGRIVGDGWLALLPFDRAAQCGF